MARRMVLVLMGLVLALEVPACAPKLVGPTAGSGYVFSLQTYTTIIWVVVISLTAAAFTHAPRRSLSNARRASTRR